jgi:hypothetical protein
MQTAGEKAEKDHILGGGPTTNLRMQMLAPNTAGDAKTGTMGGRENAIRDRGDGGGHGKRGGGRAGPPNNGHSQDGTTQAAEMARRGPTHAGVENPTPGGMRVRGADPHGVPYRILLVFLCLSYQIGLVNVSGEPVHAEHACHCL